MSGHPSIHRSTTPSLSSLIASAYLADPEDQVISRVDDMSYSTLFSVIPTALAVLRAAAELEPDPSATTAWYRGTPIAELGYLTAQQLVAMDRADAVVDFLRAIRDGVRG